MLGGEKNLSGEVIKRSQLPRKSREDHSWQKQKGEQCDLKHE